MASLDATRAMSTPEVLRGDRVITARNVAKPAPIQRRIVTVLLADGPCAGTYARVLSWGTECWQKLDRSEQVWLRYLKNLYQPGVYVWSGDARTTHDHAAAIARDTENTYGCTEGA